MYNCLILFLVCVFCCIFLFFFSIISVVIVSIGSIKKEMRSLDVASGSPKHRSSIVATSSLSVDTGLESECDISGASSHVMQHQPSLDQSSTSKAMTNLMPELPEWMNVCAESLEKILDNKLVKEKKLELEKKMEALRKKHDKEKVKAATEPNANTSRRSRFYNSRLVKRLSNRTM